MSYTPEAGKHRSEIDLAVGVLIALRSLSAADAFAELAAHARSTGTGLVPSARAIVALAQGNRAVSPAEHAAAQRWWSTRDHISAA